MGRLSGNGMGAVQNMYSVGHIPSGGYYRQRVSQKTKFRLVRAHMAKHGLYLRVGYLKSGQPLLYSVTKKKAFCDTLEVACRKVEPPNRVARGVLKTLYRTARYYSSTKMWITPKQKQAIERTRSYE